MSAAGGWLCGQEPTQANAQAIIARLHRRARLQPTSAKALLEEAEVIRELAASGALPEGFLPPLSHELAVGRHERPKAAKPQVTYTSWHFLYMALAGRRPPAQAHDAKIKAPWNQYYWLRQDGRLTMGLTVRRSLPLPRGKREELIAEGKARLAPQVATLDDLKEIFS
jgi:hypothetical protein